MLGIICPQRFLRLYYKNKTFSFKGPCMTVCPHQKCGHSVGPVSKHVLLDQFIRRLSLYTLKMESVSKITIFGLNWNSSMRKPFSSNSFHLLVLTKITNSVTKITISPHGGKSEIFFLPYVLDLIYLLEQKFCWNSNLRVKTLFESVK